MERARKVGGSQRRVVCEFEKQTRTSVGELVYGSLFVIEIVKLTSALIELHFGDLESIRSLGPVKFSGRRGKKDSMEIDSMDQSSFPGDEGKRTRWKSTRHHTYSIYTSIVVS